MFEPAARQAALALIAWVKHEHNRLNRRITYEEILIHCRSQWLLRPSDQQAAINEAEASQN